MSVFLIGNTGDAGLLSVDRVVAETREAALLKWEATENGTDGGFEAKWICRQPTPSDTSWPAHLVLPEPLPIVRVPGERALA